jgi:hypothetical protein
MLGKVEFRPEDYGPDIARILALAGGGKRPMPLVRTGEVCEAADGLDSLEVFEAVNALDSLPPLVRTGLYLYFGCWDAGHTAADSVENASGYFWHGIAHRQEPDPDNAAYWFRKTGKHPIFPQLAAEAANSGYPASSEWDPFAFIGYCESARRQPASPAEQMSAQAEGSVVRVQQIAIAVQLLEWQLLFDYCARGQSI